MNGSPASGARRKAVLRIAVTILLVGGGVGAVSSLHAIDWSAFATALASVAPLPFALAIVVSTAQVYAQLARFVVLVPPAARRPLFELLDTTAIGQLLNYATPLRAGDAYKLVRLTPRRGAGERDERRFPLLLAALVAERVADVAALFVMAAWASFPDLLAWARSLVPSSLPSKEKLVAGALAAVVLTLAVAFFAERIQRFFAGFLASMRGALWSARFVRSFAVSILTWTLDAGTLYWTTRTIGGYELSFREVMASVFVLNMGIAMPVTVGNIGIFEAALSFALTRHGVAPSDALAIATLEHVVTFSGLGLCVATLRGGRAALGLMSGRPSPPS